MYLGVVVLFEWSSDIVVLSLLETLLIRLVRRRSLEVLLKVEVMMLEVVRNHPLSMGVVLPRTNGFIYLPLLYSSLRRFPTLFRAGCRITSTYPLLRSFLASNLNSLSPSLHSSLPLWSSASSTCVRMYSSKCRLIRMNAVRGDALFSEPEYMQNSSRAHQQHFFPKQTGWRCFAFVLHAVELCIDD